MHFCEESQLHRLWPPPPPLRRPIQGHRKERQSHEKVSLDRVKPAHFECEPETGTATQRKTQPKTTNSKTTEIVRGIPEDQIKSSSTLTQKPETTRVKSTANKQTQSAANKIGKNLATTPQHQAHRVNLHKQFTPYVASPSRTPARCFPR